MHPLFLSDINETWNLLTDLRKKLKYQVSLKSVQRKPSCCLRTDRHDKANSHFSRFCERDYRRLWSCCNPIRAEEAVKFGDVKKIYHMRLCTAETDKKLQQITQSCYWHSTTCAYIQLSLTLNCMRLHTAVTDTKCMRLHKAVTDTKLHETTYSCYWHYTCTCAYIQLLLALNYSRWHKTVTDTKLHETTYSCYWH
jgi:hypothetical protein